MLYPHSASAEGIRSRHDNFLINIWIVAYISSKALIELYIFTAPGKHFPQNAGFPATHGGWEVHKN
jgi:hypothetical protein